MIPKTPFNKWILSKVIQFLSVKEGCVIQESRYTKKGAKTILTDSFGFMYEIHIKTIGRTSNHEHGIEKY